MRLFRQKTWGDWDEVFERISGQLESDLAQEDSGEGAGV
jgi:hypothetical protein